MKKITNTLLDTFEETEIDISDKSSDIEEKIIEAKDMLENYEDCLAKKIDANFDNDIWIFRDLIIYKNVTFNFSKLNSQKILGETQGFKENILYLKIWLVDILSENTVLVAYDMFRNVISGAKATNFYSKELMDRFVVNLKSNMIYRNSSNSFVYSDDYIVESYMRNNISFLNSMINKNNYISEIESVYSKISINKKNRKLPSFQIFTEFQVLIEKWYSDNKKDSDIKNKLKYYPLLLWFNLCCIIPMRPSEFCLMKRDCISSKDGKWYITFPRLKKKRKNEFRKKINYDTLIIPKRIYDLFDEYIELTSQDDDRKYMIDYKIYVQYSLDNSVVKEDVEFNALELNRLIKLFYLDYIKTKNSSIGDMTDEELANNYVDEFDEEFISNRDYILAGDLRHIAIINLMMQGYSEVEIERLSGHITKETQMNYAAHAENWMNVEIIKIQKEFRTYNNGEIISPKVDECIDNMYDCFYLEGDTEKELKLYNKLAIGYCKDPDMMCPTFNWKHSGCYFCPNWIIDKNELDNNREKIEKDMNLIYDETRTKMLFMKSLYTMSIKKQENNELLKATSYEINRGIFNIAKLKEVLKEKNE